MKLFIVEYVEDDGWKPAYLHKGSFQIISTRAQASLGAHTRVRRVKTPAEAKQYSHLNSIPNNSLEKVEWLN